MLFSFQFENVTSEIVNFLVSTCCIISMILSDLNSVLIFPFSSTCCNSKNTLLFNSSIQISYSIYFSSIFIKGGGLGWWVLKSPNPLISKVQTCFFDKMVSSLKTWLYIFIFLFFLYTFNYLSQHHI